MSLTLKEKGTAFILPHEGLHIARCYLLVDLGKQYSEYYQTISEKVLIGWEFPMELMESGKPFIQMQRYTASLSEKAALRGILNGWRGRAFSPEELDGFELKKVLGMSCYLTTKHVFNPQTNQRWSKVTSVCPLPDGVICPPAMNQPIQFDLDDYSQASYLAVPEGIRKSIHLKDVKPSKDHQAPIADRVTFYPPDHAEPQPDLDL
jgi:hypothetical protein